MRVATTKSELRNRDRHSCWQEGVSPEKYRMWCSTALVVRDMEVVNSTPLFCLSCRPAFIKSLLTLVASGSTPVSSQTTVAERMNTVFDYVARVGSLGASVFSERS